MKWLNYISADKKRKNCNIIIGFRFLGIHLCTETNFY